MANFIVISGPPGSGKSTFAESISNELNLPLFSKDNFKCIMGDYISGEGVDYSQSLGRSAIETLKLIILELSKGKGSYIVESSFLKKFENEFFESIKDRNNFLQVYCKVDSNVAFERIKKRLELSIRHKCHQDHLRLNVIKNSIENNSYEVLDFDNTVIIEINDDFSNEIVLSKIRKFVKDY